MNFRFRFVFYIFRISEEEDLGIKIFINKILFCFWVVFEV